MSLLLPQVVGFGLLHTRHVQTVPEVQSTAEITACLVYVAKDTTRISSAKWCTAATALLCRILVAMGVQLDGISESMKPR